jgi:hypothetical protein
MLTIQQARDMRQGVTLNGDRNQCAECGELFNSVYGVPQMRPRMIIVGIRNDLAVLGVVPSHPQPFAIAPTVREAWHGLVNTPDECALARFGVNRIVHRLLFYMKPGESGDQYHPNKQLYGVHRLHPDKPSPTILRNGGAGGACEACHPSEHRRITIAEAKRLASFPDSFVLRGTFEERWAAIGNCVPPLFMRAIALHVRELLGKAAQRAIEFFHDVLNLNGGEFEGKPFNLLPWQQFVVGSSFGWKRADGTRRFREVYIEGGKGCGKSPLAAGIGLYMLVAYGEARAEVYAAATRRDQAMVLFRDAVAMVQLSPALASRTTLHTDGSVGHGRRSHGDVPGI